MKIISILTLMTLAQISHADESHEKSVAVGDWDGAFHQQLHDKSKHCYLIAIYSEKRGLQGKKPKITYSATIVKTVSGDKVIGDKIVFDRVYDMDLRKKPNAAGELYYVFFSAPPMNGSPLQHDRYVDVQDPTVMLAYSKRRAEIADAHLKSNE